MVSDEDIVRCSEENRSFCHDTSPGPPRWSNTGPARPLLSGVEFFDDQDALGRVIPSFAMRVSSVVGGMPSRSAAPPTPRTRQRVLSSTLLMCAF
jgi:hypothetical protein